MNGNLTDELSVDVKDLEIVLIPLTSAQLLSAYYIRLLYARQQGDDRKADEIFCDCLKDFGKVSKMMQEALGELDPEYLCLKVKAHI
jgi:hypothetical protein